MRTKWFSMTRSISECGAVHLSSHRITVNSISTIFFTGDMRACQSLSRTGTVRQKHVQAFLSLKLLAENQMAALSFALG